MMVRALERGLSIQKSRSFHLKKMFEIPGRQTNSMILDGEHGGENVLRSHGIGERLVEYQPVGCALTRERNPAPHPEHPPNCNVGSQQDKQPSETEAMKERFAKLLLGEDMSGGGKASVFGEQNKLQAMPPERKARWRKEIDWLLSVTDYIVEFVPSQQTSNGVNMEIMVTRQRNDLHMDIPALRRLDAMLIDTLDNFGEHNEFWYVSRDSDDSDNGSCQRKDDKWWLPVVKVPPEGLSEKSRRFLQFQKDSVNQVLKAALAINAQVLSEMEIPESYIESLPKNGRASLGDSIYKSITEELFDADEFLATMDLSTEHKVLDLKNRIEASIVIWKRKMNHNKDGKSAWGSAVSLEKRELFEERAETILLLLKQRFPGLPQSSLDVSKIQYNKDVGQAILESYSRVIESLAFTVMSKIEDVLYADYKAQSSSPVVSDKSQTDSEPWRSPIPKSPVTREEVDKLVSAETPTSMTLSDFMGWNPDADKAMHKPPLSPTPKKVSYLERLENLTSLRSPTDRH
ncbi:rho guanine nucleotide exchange factor 8-like isoform X2 [Carica papaya]|uniref:rho guanine nucleotide exchange factor 8-like isoform X2 n=1 Tax=Carica papaya TaxID=3649 RepID=UPI000B8D1293|nr:rho guanine nucleotide exchange factor 8-like isoform X2 [Carica papaya]